MQAVAAFAGVAPEIEGFPVVEQLVAVVLEMVALDVAASAGVDLEIEA
jgi:hypothetical protein